MEGSTTAKTALTNVRVFDGERILTPATVVIDQGLISTDATGAEMVDCGGAVLLPGLTTSAWTTGAPSSRAFARTWC